MNRILKKLLLALAIISIYFLSQTLFASTSTDSLYIDDAANIVSNEYKKLIAENSKEIEEQRKIRVLVKTEIVKNPHLEQKRLELYFSDWIRNLKLDKRGILIHAILPENGKKGQIFLRVGIGLKYLISHEMSQKILNEVILPQNALNKDGKGFFEGILTLKKILVDDLQRETQRKIDSSQSFNLKNFFWKSKEVILAVLVAIFLFYLIFFTERCPRCNGTLAISQEILKEPSQQNLGLKRKVFTCKHCGFSRRKKEPIYPPGKIGFIMKLTGARRNVRIR